MTPEEFVTLVTSSPHAFTVIFEDKRASQFIQFHTLDADRAFAELPKDGRYVRSPVSVGAACSRGAESTIVVRALPLT